jgi:aminopeptidase YwaD
MSPYGVALVAGLFVLTGCSEADEPPPAAPVASRTPSTPPAPEKTVSTSPAPTPSGEGHPVPSFDGRRALVDVRHLAGDIGPRLATGPAFREAARWVEGRFADLHYDVARQTYPVPAGTSWGVPVDAGTSVNLVATPTDFDPSAAYYVVGAHLDTVALAPGAEDNASGIAVLLETARLARAARLTQVVFVAFGGEEPRGPGDLHHFGSKRYVAAMSPAERRHLRAMISLDRVGVGPPLTVGWVAGTVRGVRDALLRTAARIGVRTAIEENTGSDHESFADEGLPAARLGGTAYAAYHSAQDVPAVVDQAQLARAGAVLWSWLIARAR